MSAIVLTAVNARYSHPSFGLRYLLANLGDLQDQTTLLERDLRVTPLDLAEDILRHDPRIAGFGVYIWNVALVTETVLLLRRLRPDLLIVLGGPEVSHEIHDQPVCQAADYILPGEADLSFPQLCRDLLAGTPPPKGLIPSPPPDANLIALPYHLYTDEDIAHRVIYVEASRGCPFTCEFCLSSLDQHLNRFPLDRLLPAFQNLLDRGVKEFKFVDRTFNLSVPFSLQLLEFFLERYQPGMFLHFEMIPDRLPQPLREILSCYPRGALQFEVGIQTFNQDVAALISRRQNYQRTEENIRWLLEHTGAHIHADLILGLPGEDLHSIGRGFDRLLALRPQEIQVNLLKRLRGTPIIRHEQPYNLVYSPHPPYEILSTSLIDFPSMQRLRRFAKVWDLTGNSGNFIHTAPLLWSDGHSPFQRLMQWSHYLFESLGRTHAIPLDTLIEHLFTFLTQHLHLSPSDVAATLARDLQRTGRPDLPRLLRPHVPDWDASAQRTSAHTRRLKRQHRHHQPSPS
ncbi:MAG TPA: DUF4080 domain-containing protein [Kiritimatiellia bacterium]|nr:DUF4080 domain-containing protein [Kiritimatiellia bacterium]